MDMWWKVVYRGPYRLRPASPRDASGAQRPRRGGCPRAAARAAAVARRKVPITLPRVSFLEGK